MLRFFHAVAEKKERRTRRFSACSFFDSLFDRIVELQ